MHFYCRSFVLGIALVSAASAIAEDKTTAIQPSTKSEKKPPVRPAPTVANFAYAHDSPRQVFDFWKADSKQPAPLVLLIHGGGWRNGDKTGYGTSSIQPYLD